MRVYLIFLMLSILFNIGCSTSHQPIEIQHQSKFAFKAYEAQLWNEAVFRWNRILQIDPKYVPAYNNLGVAYEALGKIDAALQAYETATELDQDNRFYRFNYRRCRFLRRAVEEEDHESND